MLNLAMPFPSMVSLLVSFFTQIFFNIFLLLLVNFRPFDVKKRNERNQQKGTKRKNFIFQLLSHVNQFRGWRINIKYPICLFMKSVEFELDRVGNNSSLLMKTSLWNQNKKILARSIEQHWCVIMYFGFLLLLSSFMKILIISKFVKNHRCINQIC